MQKIRIIYREFHTMVQKLVFIPSQGREGEVILCFMQKQMNSDGHVKQTVQPPLGNWQTTKILCSFQQDSATADTDKYSMQILNTAFGERVICCGSWPPRSPYITQCDLFFQNTQKMKSLERIRRQNILQKTHRSKCHVYPKNKWAVICLEDADNVRRWGTI
jgi:hypothetical protein